MHIKDYSLEELQQMTYGEVTEIILNEKQSKMKIVDVYKKVCKALEKSEKEFEDHIADFFELVSTDSRFIVLDKGYCDLRKKHAPKVVMEEDDENEVMDDELEDDIDQEIENQEDEEDDIYYDNSSDEDDVETDDDDELSDFIVVDEDEEVNM